jgi:hypothetical protein
MDKNIRLSFSRYSGYCIWLRLYYDLAFHISESNVSGSILSDLKSSIQLLDLFEAQYYEQYYE